MPFCRILSYWAAADPIVWLSADLLPRLCSLKKLEIHKVFLRFSNFHSGQNLSLITFADWISGCLWEPKNFRKYRHFLLYFSAPV